MAEIRDRLILDVDQADAAIDRLEARLAGQPFQVRVNLEADQNATQQLQRTLDARDLAVDVALDADPGAIRALEAQLDRADFEAEVTFDVDDRGLRSIDERLESIERNVGDVVQEVAAISTQADRAATDFRELADSLGISEDAARRMSNEILEAERSAQRTETAARDVARQLGLADDDAAAFARSLRQAGQAADVVDDRMDRVSRSATRVRTAIIGALAAFGVRGLVNAADSAIDSFNLLNESVNAVNVTFEDGAGQIFDFGENVARTAGLARGTFQQLVVPVGALLRNFGFDADDAGAAAVRLTQRAADLASVFNTDVSEALEAIQAGLRGEANPLERFGAGISAARVEAFALASGLVDTKAEIDDLVRVQARYQLILADTARVQGDFARTAEDPANAARIIASEFENARATIGEGLIPAFQDLLQITPSLISDIEDLGPAIGAIATAAVNAAPGVVAFLEGTLDLVDRLTAGLQLSGVREELSEGFDAGSLGVENFTDAIEVLLSAPGDFNQFAVIFGETSVEIERQVDTIAEAFNTLKDDLDSGTAPAEALAEALGFVNENATITGTALEVFARRAGLAGDDLRSFLTSFLDSSRAFGLTADELLVINNLIARLTFESGGAEAEWERFQSVLSRSDGLADVETVIDDGIITLRELQDAARAAGVGIAEAFGSDLFPAGSIFTVFATAEAEVAAFRDRVNAIGQDIDPMKGAVDALEISKDEFVANLTAAFEQSTEFEANLARLSNRGFDALADSLRELGPGAAGLVEDFLNDAASASAAESVLQPAANQFARDYEEALRAEFRGSIFTGLPDEVAQALARAFQSDPGTGFDSLAEKQARTIRQGLSAGAALTELEGAGAEMGEETTDGFADRVAELAPAVGFDAAVDIARALTASPAAREATEAGARLAELVSRAFREGLDFTFQAPTITGSPTQAPTTRAPQTGPTGTQAVAEFTQNVYTTAEREQADVARFTQLAGATARNIRS